MKPCKETQEIRLKSVFALAIFVAGLSCCAFAEAADWPNWRGPNHDGTSTETGWSTTWPKDGPKILWKTSVGNGYSSPVISKGRLYTMGNTAKKDDDKEQLDIVYCLNADTGKEIWRHSYPHRLDTYKKVYEGGPLASPAVEGSRVYTISKDGNALCLDAGNGSVLWEKELLREYKISRNTWGVAGSPLILDNMVIYNVGPWGIALNQNDGALVWETGKDTGGYSSAVPFTYKGRKLIAVFGAKAMAVLVANTGKLLWQIPWETSIYDMNISDVVIEADTMFISSGHGKGCALLKFTDTSFTELWRNKNMRNQCHASVLWQGHFYGFDGQVEGSRGQLRCLDYITGQVKWSKSGFGVGTLIIADGKLIILSETGELVIAEASPNGFKQLAYAKVLSHGFIYDGTSWLAGDCWTPPVLANGRIYLRNATGELVCVDVRPETNK